VTSLGASHPPPPPSPDRLPHCKTRNFSENILRRKSVERSNNSEIEPLFLICSGFKKQQQPPEGNNN
jgi:hypothetical protein